MAGLPVRGAANGLNIEKVLALLHHRREVLECHVGTGTGIIEPPVCIFLDRGGLVRFRHGSHMHTEDKEPNGTAEGQTSNASQQSKHFQCGSATVLCTTANSEASPPLGSGTAGPRKPGPGLADGPRHSDGFPTWSASHFFSKMPSAPFLNAPRH